MIRSRFVYTYIYAFVWCWNLRPNSSIVKVFRDKWLLCKALRMWWEYKIKQSVHVAAMEFEVQYISRKVCCGVHTVFSRLTLTLSSLSLSISLSLSLPPSLPPFLPLPLVISMSMAQFAPRRIIESPFSPYPEGSYCLRGSGDVITNGYIPASPPYTPTTSFEQVGINKQYTL